MSNVETKSFHVSGWQGKRNRQLAKLNKQGWELVQFRLMLGAGIGVALMQRPAIAAPDKPSPVAAAGGLLGRAVARMEQDNARNKQERQKAAQARKVTK